MPGSSPLPFTVAGSLPFTSGNVYFVNDASTAGDQYCSAAGSDANDGLTASTPKDSLQAILNNYGLKPGDTVFFDVGTYNLTNDVVVGSTNTGSASSLVHIVGVKGKTILDRGAASASGTSCLVLSAPYVSVENLICRNAYWGIQVNANNCSLLNNTVSGCGYNGIYINEALNALLSHNVVVHSGSGPGISLQAYYYDGYFSLPCTLVNNTVVATNADGIATSTGGGPQLENNIIQVSGSGHYCVSASDITAISSSDFNELYPQNGAQIGKIYQANGPDLFTWRALSSWDAHSLSVDPLFADSTNGDFHLKSAAGRYDPYAGKPPTDPTAWVTDSVTSLAIDAGDPADAVGDESLPNGGRINLGAFGGTAEASRSSSATRIVNVLSPNGGEVWSGFEAVELRTAGSGLQSGDTLRLECSGDGGTTWQTLPGGDNVPATQTRFWWDTRSVTNGSHYLVRATVLQDASVQDVSDQMFRIANLVAPQILAQPQSQAIPVSSNLTFSVTVNDTILLSYQWFKNGTNIVGATNATITLNNVTFNAAGDYTVLVANPAGFVLSDPATLVVLGPPIISAQPASQNAGVGDDVSFTVTANGTQPLSYFWRKDGATLPGAPNDRTLILNNVTTNNAGGYTVVVTNVAGSVTSSVATLTIVVRPPNDNFTNRIVITGLDSTVTGSNVNATMEPGEPFHYASSGGKSVWWTWTAPASGPVVMDTIGSSFDTIMAVYTDPTLPTNISNRIASDDDSGGNTRSRVSFNAVAGVAYQIAVDGYNGSSGNITLNVRLNIPTLEMPSRLANGVFEIQLAGPVGSNYVIQASTDFTTWTPIATNVIPAAGFIPIADAGATNYTRRFYRAVSP